MEMLKMNTLEELLIERGIYLDESVSTSFTIDGELKQFVNSKGKFDPPKNIQMVANTLGYNSVTTTLDQKDVGVIALLLYCYKHKISGNIIDHILGLKVSKAKSGILIIKDNAIIDLNKTDMKILDIKDRDECINAVFSIKGPQKTFSNPGLARLLLTSDKFPKELNRFIELKSYTRTEYTFMMEVIDKIAKNAGQIKRGDLSFDSFGVKRDMLATMITNDIISETQIGQVKWLTMYGKQPKVNDINKLISNEIKAIESKHVRHEIVNIKFKQFEVTIEYTETKLAYWSKDDRANNNGETKLVNDLNLLQDSFPDYTFKTIYVMPYK